MKTDEAPTRRTEGCDALMHFRAYRVTAVAVHMTGVTSWIVPDAARRHGLGAEARGVNGV